MNKPYKDLTGKKYGRLVVLECCGKNIHGKYLWKCKCDCGNITTVIASYLTTGHTQSCGCYHNEQLIKSRHIDLIGQRFGKLVVLEEHGRKNKCVLWKCKCDCGNDYFAITRELRFGVVKSCGCQKSMPEQIIAKYLDNHHIKYEREKKFPNCKYIHELPFDFYLPEYGIIEYDGEFHYKYTKLGNDLKLQQKRDKIKTEFCDKNNIRLLRIPYWDKENIESILSEWLNIYDAEDANSSDVAL